MKRFVRSIASALVCTLALGFCSCGNKLDIEKTHDCIERFADEPLYILNVTSHLETALDGLPVITDMSFEKFAQKLTDGSDYYQTKGTVSVDGQTRAEPDIYYYSMNGLLHQGGNTYSINTPKEDYDRLSYASFCYTVTDVFLPTEQDLRRASVRRDGTRTEVEINAPSQEMLDALAAVLKADCHDVRFSYTLDGDALAGYAAAYTMDSDGGDLIYCISVEIRCAGDGVPVIEAEDKTDGEIVQ